MKLSEQLFESVKDIWESYYSHPFLEELGKGTLDISKFRFYMIQDYLYLLDYAKVFAFGVIKSKDEDVMRNFAQMVHHTLDGEMKIHKSYMERLGITKEEVENAKPALANTSYTSYMLAVGEGQGVLELLVSILSCAWSYQEIGAHLAKIPGALEHPLYGEWVQGYTGEEYVGGTKDIIELVDKLGKDCTEVEINNLKDIFIRCSRYEYLFWDMAYKKEM